MALALQKHSAVVRRTATQAAARPVRVVAASRRPVTVAASASKANVAVAAAGVSALVMAIAPAAQAAQEAMMIAEGEPAIVQIGWAATAMMFSFSLSLVVWGRSGM